MERTKTRKAHTKSRNGCLGCKARHLKCDEIKPTCSNCDKYGTKCDYPVPKARRKSSYLDTSPDRINSTPSSTEALHPLPTELVLNIPDLRMLHHYTTITALTLSTDSQSQKALSSYVVNVAFNHPFLLHAILAFAALHLSRLEEHRFAEYQLQAVQHHDAALTQFRASVQEVDSSNFEAVFSFTAMMFPYSCALPMESSYLPEQLLDIELQNMAITRGVRSLVGSHYQDMHESPLRQLVPSDIKNIDRKDRPAETELTDLRAFSDSMLVSNDGHINEAYADAIQALEVLFARCGRLTDAPSVSLLKMWPLFVSPHFVDLLSERLPGALIIFAHYAVLLKRGNSHYWFLDGYAERLLHIADSLLPADLRQWLKWPKQQILGT